jgi:hypothetical protein
MAKAFPSMMNPKAEGRFLLMMNPKAEARLL